MAMRSLADEADAGELRRRLGAIRADSRGLWGRMTAPQMVCHLCDACRMALGEKAVRPVAVGVRAALLKMLALYVPIRWPAGKVQTVEELDQAINPAVCRDFAVDVADLERLMRVLASSRALSPTHPIFGPMSHGDWMRWAWLHTDHHLRQFGA
jgi:hypothetical protein